ncbi:hypothetical protein KXQ82_18535 [Mucilaginibacter sp. HMF5004]|uniref:hypothetical protein n=1 Tax=Mucilaginibacter rivuli TaxID=2857527 RepID=UPI001C5EF2C0|nr:hypothetical protein [Mucilaginibacter rivuli]MBW4891729.1 hypothetical protein [Mucilaginibacter rivuli]
MKPLGWLFLLAPFVLTGIGYYVLYYIKKHKRDADLQGTVAFLVAIFTGIVGGYLAFIPIGYLCFAICPNLPHNGHYGMPMGQYFSAIVLTVIFGIVVAIVAGRRILRWQKK